MKKKKPGEKVEYTPEYDSERETRVLLNRIGSDVKIVAEGHGTIIRRLDELDSELTSVKTAVMDNSRELTSVKKAVMDNSREIKDLKTDVKGLKTGQERIEQKLDTTLADHEQRLTKVEEKVGA